MTRICGYNLKNKVSVCAICYNAGCTSTYFIYALKLSGYEILHFQYKSCHVSRVDKKTRTIYNISRFDKF